MELIDPILSYETINRCAICDRKFTFYQKRFCFCAPCWSELPRKSRADIEDAQEKGDVDRVRDLLVESYNLFKMTSELKGTKNCVICGKKLGFLDRNPTPTSLCGTCIETQPEKWRQDLKQASSDGRFDQIKKLAEIAISGGYNYDIPDLLSPKHGSFDYRGGHPDFPKLIKVSLTDRSDGIVAFDQGTKSIHFVIEWNRITDISADNRIVTESSAGLAGLGLLAGRQDLAIMGAALRNNKKLNYLNIRYKGRSGLDTTIAFEGKKAYEAAAYFISAISNYRKDEEANQGNPGDVNAKSTSPNPITQIKNLSELRDSGILTNDEFELKKKELLSRI